jgi:secreted trypsin-like serine protease
MFFLNFVTLICIVRFTAAEIESHIIGGIPVPETNENFKSVVSLQRSRHVNGEWAMVHFCGGSLVAPSWVLTAGHCVKYGSKPSQVRIGSYDNQNGGYVRKVSEVISHPKYTGSGGYDVALLLLDKPVDGNVKFMELDNGQYDKDKTPLISMGWGYTIEGLGQVTRYLRQVDLEVITNDFCNTMYPGRIDESMLCTWGKWDEEKKYRKDACSGDSGSANFWYDKDMGQTVIVGITSWGKGCGREDYAGVTARVSHVVEWIKSKIEPIITARPTSHPTIRPSPPVVDVPTIRYPDKL